MMQLDPSELKEPVLAPRTVPRSSLRDTTTTSDPSELIEPVLAPLTGPSPLESVETSLMDWVRASREDERVLKSERGDSGGDEVGSESLVRMLLDIAG